MPTVEEIRSMRRTMRRPQHPFQIRYRPWQIQPCMIAPVLPGETLKKLMLQSRVVTDPIRNKLTGWWTEYFFFYCKMSDLPSKDLWTDMFLDPETDITAQDTATSVPYYHHNGDSGKDVNWLLQCVNSITQEYFRYEGEDTVNIDGIAAAGVNIDNWSNSLELTADVVTDGDTELLDISAGTAGGGDDKLMYSEVLEAQRQYLMVSQAGLTDMTFEEYCAQYGLNVAPQRAHVPELIRYFKDWSYPTNTITQGTGVASSAVSWVIGGQANKHRLFTEPGFIVGLTVTRPKVYFRNQRSAAVVLMNDARRWVPPQLWDDPQATLVTMTGAGNDALGEWTASMQMDIKDLFIYGDQFVNFDRTVTDANMVDLPALDGTNRRYPTIDDAKELFVDETNDVLTRVRADGIVSLEVATRLTDTSRNYIGNQTVE